MSSFMLTTYIKQHSDNKFDLRGHPFGGDPCFHFCDKRFLLPQSLTLNITLIVHNSIPFTTSVASPNGCSICTESLVCSRRASFLEGPFCTPPIRDLRRVRRKSPLGVLEDEEWES